jgi:hypothetical protein
MARISGSRLLISKSTIALVLLVLVDGVVPRRDQVLDVAAVEGGDESAEHAEQGVPR